MSTPFMTSGARYVIRFTADANNQHETRLFEIWVPRGANAPSKPRELAVAQGTTGALNGTCPTVQTHRFLRLFADVPDGGGGDLVIIEGEGQAARDVMKVRVTGDTPFRVDLL